MRSGLEDHEDSDLDPHAFERLKIGQRKLLELDIEEYEGVVKDRQYNL